MYCDAVNMLARERLRVQRMVEIVGKYDAITRQGVMAELGLKKEGIRNFRVSYWYPARDAGYVQMVYSESPNCPVQAYKLTPKGKVYYADLEDQNIGQNIMSKKD